REVMKRPVLLVLCGALLTASAHGANTSRIPDASPLKAHVPDTVAAHRAADLIARAEHAISAYLTATETRNQQVSNLWIFPTGDDSSVFIQYDVRGPGNSSPQRQLALLEMRGERIARMVNFSGGAPMLVAKSSGN